MKDETLLKKVKKFGFVPTVTGNLVYFELQDWLMKEFKIEVMPTKSISDFSKTGGHARGEYFYIIHMYYDLDLSEYNTFYPDGKGKKYDNSYQSFIEQLKLGIIHGVKLLQTNYVQKTKTKQKNVDVIALHYANEAEKRCIPRNDKMTLEIINESVKKSKKTR